jgi:hypothetical protein
MLIIDRKSKGWQNKLIHLALLYYQNYHKSLTSGDVLTHPGHQILQVQST